MDLLWTGVAYAQEAGAAAKGPSMIELLIMPIGFLFIMYFLILRPQQKRMREHRNLLENLKSGDEIVTSGGIINVVRSVAKSFVTIEVSNNTLVKVLKANVTMLTKEMRQPNAAVKAK